MNWPHPIGCGLFVGARGNTFLKGEGARGLADPDVLNRAPVRLWLGGIVTLAVIDTGNRLPVMGDTYLDGP